MTHGVLEQVEVALTELLPPPVRVTVLPALPQWTVKRLAVTFGEPPCEPWLVFEDSGGLMATQLSGQQLFIGLEKGLASVVSEIAAEMQQVGRMGT